MCLHYSRLQNQYCTFIKEYGKINARQQMTLTIPIIRPL